MNRAVVWEVSKMVALGILVTLVLVTLLVIAGELALIYEEIKIEKEESENNQG